MNASCPQCGTRHIFAKVLGEIRASTVGMISIESYSVQIQKNQVRNEPETYVESYSSSNPTSDHTPGWGILLAIFATVVCVGGLYLSYRGVNCVLSWANDSRESCDFFHPDPTVNPSRLTPHPTLPANTFLDSIHCNVAVQNHFVNGDLIGLREDYPRHMSILRRSFPTCVPDTYCAATQVGSTSEMLVLSGPVCARANGRVNWYWEVEHQVGSMRISGYLEDKDDLCQVNFCDS